jgi:hypothetical protein
MKVLRVAAVMALMIAPAYAQMPNINLVPELPSKTPEEKEADRAREKAYQDTLKKIPDAKTSSDPWGGVRSDAAKPSSGSSSAKPSGTAAPKTSAKAKPKIQTGIQTGVQTGSNAN